MSKIIFSLSASRTLAKNVAKLLDCELGKSKISRFKDGEVLAVTQSDVKGKDVILIQSTSKPANTHLFEILLFVDSLKRGGAKSIKLFIPYLGYSRQDHAWNNEPISIEIIARILDGMNVNTIYSFDIHTERIKNFFKTELVNIYPSKLFADYFKKLGLDTNNVVVVAPDHGSNERAQYLKEALNAKQLVVLNKYRPMPNVAEHLMTDENFENMDCILVDDIIDTGGTLVSATKLLRKKGAKHVYICGTHGVFSDHAEEKLLKENIDGLVVTNTISKRRNPSVKVLDVSSLIVEKVK